MASWHAPRVLASTLFKQVERESQRSVAAVLIYTAWNLSKERNRRTFQETPALPTTVFQRIKEGIEVERRDARGGPELVWLSNVSGLDE
jgi:hypothetical protein